MNKETIIAIIMGIVLGGGIGAYVLFRTGQGTDTKLIPVTGDSASKKVVKTDVPQDLQLLTIDTPKASEIVAKNEITISGKAQKNSLIVVQSPLGNEVIKNKDESFSLKFALARGQNIINISAYSNSSNPQEVTLPVYFIDTK